MGDWFECSGQVRGACLVSFWIVCILVASKEMILWVQQRFPSLFINVVTFIRANLSRRTSFNLASNCCWPLRSAVARNLPSLWKRVLCPVFCWLWRVIMRELVEGWLSSPVQFFCAICYCSCQCFKICCFNGRNTFSLPLSGPRQTQWGEEEKLKVKVQRRALADHEGGRAYLLPL